MTTTVMYLAIIIPTMRIYGTMVKPLASSSFLLLLSSMITTALLLLKCVYSNCPSSIYFKEWVRRQHQKNIDHFGAVNKPKASTSSYWLCGGMSPRSMAFCLSLRFSSAAASAARAVAGSPWPASGAVSQRTCSQRRHSGALGS